MRILSPNAIASPWVSKPGLRAFTMVEIAISIAIIAFALVAIVGVLPQGLNVQRDNKLDTTFGQDGELILSAIRHGASATNLTVLSNNLDWAYFAQNGVGNYFTNLAATQIVSYLSTPAITYNAGAPVSNYVMVKFRRFSGPLSDQSPPARPLALSYVVFSSITNALNYTNVVGNLTNVIGSFANGMSNNAFEVRLTLAGPFLGPDQILNAIANNLPLPAAPPTSIGARKLVFRTTIASRMTNSNGTNFFFDPNTFVGQ